MGCTSSIFEVVDSEKTVSKYWHHVPSESEVLEEFEAEGTGHVVQDRSMLELRALLDYPLGRKFLQDYGNTLAPFVLICLCGWLDIHAFNVMSEGSRETAKLATAKTIYKKYVHKSALVGLQEQEAIAKKLADGHSIVPGLFDEVKTAYFLLLHDHLFMPFKLTPEYDLMCSSLRKKYNRVTYSDFSYYQLIGQGGFGLVAEVSKKSTGARYAMKLQRKDQLASIFPFEPWRADLEKRAFASCHHPFIVELFFAFQTETLLAMVTTLGTGRDLSKILKINGPLSVAQVRFYSAEVTSALSYLHGKGFVYRDLKPGNILLNMDGHIQLVDFGGVHDTNGKLIEACKDNCHMSPVLSPQDAEPLSQQHPLSHYWSSIAKHFTPRPSVASHRKETRDIRDSNVLVLKSSGPDFDMLCAQYRGDPSVFVELQQKYHELDQATVMRHLLACKGDYEKTVAHIDACQQWRMRTFVNMDIPDHQSSGEGCLMYTHGFDKVGHPLIVFTSRLLDVKTRSLPELVRWIIYIFELAIERLPPHLEQFVVLSNRIGSSSADLEMVKAVVAVVERYYPFRMAKVLIHPVSLAVKAIGGVIKSIAGSQASNFHFVESLDELRGHIPDEYIPAEMGGSCTYKFDIKDYPPPALYESNIHHCSVSSSICPLEGIDGLSSSSDAISCPGSLDFLEQDQLEGPKQGSKRAHSIVGTYSYMAPEMVIMLVEAPNFEHTAYTKAVDWWSLGVTIYRLLTGEYPFKTDIPKPRTPEAVLTEGSDRYNALLEPVNYSRFEEHTDAVDIVSQLLTVSDKERLGYGPSGSTAVSAHRFFRDLNWVELEEKKSAPPPLPCGCIPHRSRQEGGSSSLSFEQLMAKYKKTAWLVGGDSTPPMTPTHHALWDDLLGWDFASPAAIVAELDAADRLKLVSCSSSTIPLSDS